MYKEPLSQAYVAPKGHEYYVEVASVPPTPTPTPTPPTPSSALSGTVNLQQLLYPHRTQDERVSVVKAWITELVRKELGPALDKVDRRHKFDLFTHGIDFVQADLITKALMLKAQQETAACKTSRKKSRRSSKKA